MPILAFSSFAGVGGTTTVRITPNKSGIQWSIAQVGIESVPQRATANATVRVNGRYITSSAILPSSASGTPAINLQYFEEMTVDFVGLTSGDNAVVTVFYTESPWGYTPNVDVV